MKAEGSSLLAPLLALMSWNVEKNNPGLESAPTEHGHGPQHLPQVSGSSPVRQAHARCWRVSELSRRFPEGKQKQGNMGQVKRHEERVLSKQSPSLLGPGTEGSHTLLCPDPRVGETSTLTCTDGQFCTEQAPPPLLPATPLLPQVTSPTVDTKRTGICMHTITHRE